MSKGIKAKTPALASCGIAQGFCRQPMRHFVKDDGDNQAGYKNDRKAECVKHWHLCRYEGLALLAGR